jgi:selenide,water dikinase
MIELNAGSALAMMEVGVNSATDVTGFGLAGHGYEMALGSGTTLIIELSKLPLISGAENLVEKKYFTRASKTNREYVQGDMRIEGSVDPVRLEFFFDAQTSGGLLISVPAERAELLVQKARQRGAARACIIGEVVERGAAILDVKM